jgi:3-oxoacyl-[acyl-carrier protein] reductase
MTSRPAEDFRGKTAVVTGGSQGIGRAVASAFAAAGANVVVAARNGEAASRSAQAIERETGARAIAIRTDVGFAADCVRLIDEAAATFGGVDVLVNNAALFALIPLSEATPEDAGQFFNINFNGPLFCGQALARWAIANKKTAAIVNVSSISAARPAPGCGLYSATKAALDSLTKSMALEWSGKGVRVNGVAPGHVSTDGVEADFADGRIDRSAMLARIPAGRIADVADVADAVLFLASDRARHIVGTTLTIDGGEGM